MDIKNTYKQLTNVDITKQQQLWDERGKGYYGEYLVFNELYKKIPGACKILMNLEIPAENNKTTEIDLLMIHETGIYVFEIKHYKGTIYGRDTDNIWTQYFRTTKNSHFKNPILQNEYHIKAIKKLLPDIPIYSLVVFTNNGCTIKVENHNFNVDLCVLETIQKPLSKRFSNATKIYSIEEIDYLFNILSKYSKMNEPITINEETKSFNQWIEPTINSLKIKKQELEEEKFLLNQEQKKYKKNSLIMTISFIIISLLCIIFSIIVVNEIKNNYNDQLSKFKQNFQHVDEINNNYIKTLNEYVFITDITINNLASNAVSFKATLSMNNDLYGMKITENSKYIVMTSSNKVYEYNVFGEHLRYNAYSNMIGKGIKTSGTLKEASFFGPNKDEITYIKLTEVELFKLDTQKTLIKDNLELELYKKEN